MHKDDLGQRGEELAARYLQRRGMTVLSRNWRCRLGELDVVAVDSGGRRLVVCEVKTRSGAGYGQPDEAVTPAKVGRIRRAAHQWLMAHRVRWCEVRFDVLAVHWPPGGRPRINHVAGAF